MALLAGSEVRAVRDGEDYPGEVGRVDRRRASSMHVDPLEEVVCMAEQTLRRRTGRCLPRRSREPAGVGRREIDRAGAGGVAAVRRVTSAAGDVLPPCAVLMTGLANE